MAVDGARHSGVGTEMCCFQLLALVYFAKVCQARGDLLCDITKAFLCS